MRSTISLAVHCIMIGSLVMGTVGFWGSARASLNVAKPSKTQRTSL